MISPSCLPAWSSVPIPVHRRGKNPFTESLIEENMLLPTIESSEQSLQKVRLGADSRCGVIAA